LELTVKVPAGSERVEVLGAADRNLKMIREALGVTVLARDGTVQIRGTRDAVLAARNILSKLSARSDAPALDRRALLDLISEEMARPTTERLHEAAAAGVESDGWDGSLDVYSRGRAVRPRSGNQDRYLTAIRDHDLVFGIGPAGTGKTYLAVAAAVHLLRTDRVSKVILVRPAVEAGEKLGFLPGDLQAKVNPYLRPLLDALHDMMDYPTIRRFMENDVIEIAPLAYMRGRTLNSSVIILDEAQNTTRGQMKMFLTRLGHGSKMIVTGDVTQIDLEDPTQSGLIDAARRLGKSPGVSIVTLDKTDVVRHPLVQRVIEAYGDDDARPAREDGLA
jgi:phosphate starvation-inducible PhoH-like protein